MTRVAISEMVEEDRWDEFLEGQEVGQFQQTTWWARAKQTEGWQPRRFLLLQDQEIIGGAQVLVNKTRLGRIGFVNKGPMAAPGAERYLPQLYQCLVEAQRSQGWLALIQQGPDCAKSSGPDARLGFVPERMLGIINSTLLIDLSAGWEAVQAGFRRRVRRDVRMARERGVFIIEGDERDLPVFFDLMARTCRRQQTKPNPPDLPSLQALWRAFAPRSRARLHFAAHEGRKLAGGLLLVCGQRVTGLKKGWDQTHSGLHVNTLLTHDAVRWVADHAYRYFDFVAVDRDIAEALAQQRELPEDVKSRRDFFNLGFGGQGWLLPPALIRFGNPVLRVLYRVAGSGPVCALLRRGARPNRAA